MQIKRELLKRSTQCELCGSEQALEVYAVAPERDSLEGHALLCATCRNEIAAPEYATPHHWRCLNDSMWSEVPAVQVLAYRMLYHLKNEGWTQDLLDMLYLDEETLDWAKATLPDEDAIIHLDANGSVLEAGDTVVLIKDLPVKGTSLVAKRGLAVRRITLVHDNPDHIEGKVEGQRIVILTKFVKKSK